MDVHELTIIDSVFYVLPIITLCAYAQQGYAFGRVGLCTYVYVYIFVDKKQAV